MSNTAWLCYARTRVLWRDVNHHAARRDKVLWRGTGTPVTTCKEDLEVIRVTVISNGHFNMPLRTTNIPLITTLTVTGDCCDIRIDKHGAFSSAISFVGYSERNVI